MFQGGYRCEHLGEVFGKCDCLCFCDIPDSALSIHTQKYSKFGIGFDKTFVAKQGAHPVMYVPENYLIRERGDISENASTSSPKEPKLYYPYLLGITTNLLSLIVLSLSTVNMQQLENNLKSMGLKEHLNLLDDEVRKKFLLDSIIR